MKDCLFLALTSPLSWKISAMSEKRKITIFLHMATIMSFYRSIEAMAIKLLMVVSLFYRYLTGVYKFAYYNGLVLMQ
ncbi:hypothetical protein D3M71_16025 [Erwinia billingiae]|nr:hypothetical protein [Erwinia billingiae]